MDFIKPVVEDFSSDGNVFACLGQCTKALKEVRLINEAKELTEKVFNADSYDEALSIMMDYVEIGE